ncbi:MAG: helix-hairpin-helix domain-containing protein [Ferruginibacter sp.]
MLKKDKYNYLSFTRKERSGIMIILTVILIFLFIPFLFPLIYKEESFTTSEYSSAIDSLKILKGNGERNFSKYQSDEKEYSDYASSAASDVPNTPAELFYFDPNTLSVQGWVRLGVREKTANTIQRYISKGGKFRQPDDIKKIWGLRPDLVERMLPYVRIAQTTATADFENKNYPPYEKKTYEKKIISSVDINEGDSLAYLSLPGIGPSFARRIINFRNKLGGFYSINQVGETFGLPDSTFQKIKPLLVISAEGVRTININTATLDELKVHPYIRYQLANLLVQYRTQHGPYTSINDIKKIMVIDAELYNKISPYLVTE